MEIPRLKCVLVILSIGAFVSAARSQEPAAKSFYPLAVGNCWEYDSYASFTPWDTMVVEIPNDTTFDGHTYFVITSRFLRSGQRRRSFERADSTGNIVTGIPATHQEILQYRLSDTSASWWSDNAFSLCRFDSCGLLSVFGDLHSVLYIGSYGLTDTILQTQALLVQGIGYYSTRHLGQIEPGGDFLHGARINGQIFGTITGVADNPHQGIPSDFMLDNAYPNPFNPSITLRYSLPVRTRVQIHIYDLLGTLVQSVVDQMQGPGTYTVHWNASGKPSGVYVCRIRAMNTIHQQKLLLIR